MKTLLLLATALASLSFLDPARGVLLSTDKAFAVLKQCSRTRFPDVSETWEPAAEQLPALEEALSDALRRGIEQYSWSGSYKPNVRNYYRQYVGIVLNGKKVIYVNGFDDSYAVEIQHQPAEKRAARYLQGLPAAFRDSESWRWVPVVVCDGGPRYFGALYDPQTGTVVRFEFNGN